ncbi:hypothetical protein [Stutzerimonas nitrititolerans]|uniref:hypothetical protein n=1 Tax=Stutzerimonas nitrititolerans TaxID=2482751 RepID=UPI00264A49FC|nr:hypothetical protein [Stutzerimonas nitrititolerans]
MSIPDFAANEGLASFGFPWHGLFVAPIDGPSYVQLPSGRLIFSDMFRAQIGSNTYLVDLGLPEPATQPDDPEASLWNTFIGSAEFISPTSGLHVWGATEVVRRVRTSAGFNTPVISVTNYPAAGGRAVRVRANVHAYPSPQMEVHLPAAELGGLVEKYSIQRLLDVTPDGRRWIIALQFTESYPTYPYAIRVEVTPDEGLGVIIEVAFSEDFDSMSARVLATFEDCRQGRNVTGQDGGELSQETLWLTRENGTSPWVEAGASEPPTPPYTSPSEGGEGPWKVGISSVTGTSTATASREVAASAWYTPEGVAEVVWLKVSTTKSVAVSAPTERTDVQQWWSPYVREYQYEAQVRFGSGAYQTFFSASHVEDKSPESTTYTSRFSSVDKTETQANLPVSGSDPRGELFYGTAGQTHDGAPLAFVIGSGRYTFRIHALHRSSNKVLSSVLQQSSDGFFGYAVGPAITPAGVDGGAVATGNLIPGHNRNAPDFDINLWNYHRTFANGAYNPVSGEVERQRLGGATFTWV